MHSVRIGFIGLLGLGSLLSALGGDIPGEPSLLQIQRILERKKLENKDAAGVAHYPGWSKAALTYLYEERKITASGHETTDTDPGIATSKEDYSLEAYILSTNHYQIELLANLDQVPETGALVIVSFPKPKDGSGFPARVFAICPQ
jgi:kynurenine formamidase